MATNEEIREAINSVSYWQSKELIKRKDVKILLHTAQLILDARESLPQEQNMRGDLEYQIPATYEFRSGYNQCLFEVTPIVARLKGEIEEIKKNALEVEENVKEECRGAINVDAYATIQKLQSENSALREKVGKLTNALSAVQMLIEEDIEENNGFTFNRKRMLEKIEEVLK